MIELKNIIKKYDGKVVLDEISFKLPKNKITAFIGSNGAGKSTLLSIIGRTLSKDSGEVIVEGKEISEWNTKELSKNISILKQSNSLNIKLTVRELVSFGRFPYSRDKLTEEDEMKIDNAISYLSLEEIQNKYLDELSGGQKQMAFIAMVIAQDTEYILLDEPLNNLDMKNSVQMMKILKKLVEELGKTVVLVIHDINFASVYADYIIALKHGKLLVEGLKKDVIESSKLKEIYDINIKVENINGDNICLYYT